MAARSGPAPLDAAERAPEYRTGLLLARVPASDEPSVRKACCLLDRGAQRLARTPGLEGLRFATARRKAVPGGALVSVGVAVPVEAAAAFRRLLSDANCILLPVQPGERAVTALWRELYDAPKGSTDLAVQISGVPLQADIGALEAAFEANGGGAKLLSESLFLARSCSGEGFVHDRIHAVVRCKGKAAPPVTLTLAVPGLGKRPVKVAVRRLSVPTLPGTWGPPPRGEAAPLAPQTAAHSLPAAARADAAVQTDAVSQQHMGPMPPAGASLLSAFNAGTTPAPAARDAAEPGSAMILGSPPPLPASPGQASVNQGMVGRGGTASTRGTEGPSAVGAWGPSQGERGGTPACRTPGSKGSVYFDCPLTGRSIPLPFLPPERVAELKSGSPAGFGFRPG